MSDKLTIALAPGDGIGPEITKACLHVFEAAGVMDKVEFKEVEMGQRVFETGETRGMTDEAMNAIETHGILYKGPMGTPIGGGGKSINVTLRKTFGAFANLRHFQSLPGVETVFSKAGVHIDFVVVRENVEDTYGGIEHKLTEDVVQNLRLISAPGSDQVHKYAFETAKKMGLKTIHCGHKANIMKITDGMFLNRFYEVGKDYADIEQGEVIVDALCMNLVLYPTKYDMIVLPNLQGDIVSDLAAGLVGGLGFAPSANIGDRIAIFEAVHGTAPDIAGQGIANPTSLLLSGLMMLRHIGLVETADNIHNALLCTLEQGVHTGDVKGQGDPVNTMGFAQAIAERLGQRPTSVEPRSGTGDEITFEPMGTPDENEMMFTYPKAQIDHVGCDIYLGSRETPEKIAAELEKMCEDTPLLLRLISARGTQVWPTGSLYTECVDHHRCRFERRDESSPVDSAVCHELLKKVGEKFHVVCYIPLKNFDGERGYLLAQGQ
jgi:isocitrate dehydrogenase